MVLNIGKEITTLNKPTVPELRRQYAEAFREGTTSRHKEFLIRRIIWRLQANLEGDLSERALLRARELAAVAIRKSDAPAVCCAVYTRKSSEEGLEQEFNSLDAQREAGEAYIASQRGEGWSCLPDRYDDGGYTGGNMERPALKRLVTDIGASRVHCVVV